ncbi:MAG: TlpA family protein disulfide reductase [Gammaproteobacteria bacterium]
MKPSHLGFLALALLAGSAGYLLQAWSQRQSLTAAQALGPVAEAPAPGSEPVKPLDWSFKDLEGRDQPLAQWRGKHVVLNFWATWCPPCLKEIPAFIDLQRTLEARGLTFVGVALDEVAPVQAFVAEHGVNYPVLVGDQDVARLMSALGNEIGGLPYTVVLDPEGQVLMRHQGEWHREDAGAALEGYLGGAVGASAEASNSR